VTPGYSSVLGFLNNADKASFIKGNLIFYPSPSA
jgi:hypothetical protein